MPKSSSRQSAKSDNPSDADRQFVLALARGLDILRCFDAAHPELGSMEISALTGLPQPTVWRLCYTLVKCGCLVQSARNEKFRVGLGVLGLGHSAIWSSNRRDLVLQEMLQIALLSGCAVSLAMPDKADMLIIERCIPQSMLVINLQVGSRLPIATTAMGWAYLSGLPDAQRAVFSKNLGIARNRSLRKEVDQAVAFCHEKGYVTNFACFHPEVNAIAVPISLSDSGQLLAINCGGPASTATPRLLEREIAPRLLALARSIGQSLEAADFPLFNTNSA